MFDANTDNKPLIVLVSGKAGSGKDTVAMMAAEYMAARDKQVLITHFADELKDMCRKCFYWDGIKDEYGRSLLQRVGSAYRSIDQDFWVRSTANLIRHINPDVAIVADARYDNEILFWEHRGYRTYHIHVDRKEYDSKLTHKQQAHESENGISDELMMLATRIDNNHNLNELEQNVEEVIRQWM